MERLRPKPSFTKFGTLILKCKTMKKNLSFLLLGLFVWPWAVSAQETLTVYEGTKRSEYVPFYCDYFYYSILKSQHVIPAADLGVMDGDTIKGVQYYTTKTSVYTSASAIDFYLKEVDYNTISSFEDKSTASVVYTGTVTIESDGVTTIMFDTPYVYNGGNLLVGAENLTSEGNYPGTFYFYGQQISGAAIWAKTPFTDIHTEYFIPKTTFIYAINTTCPKPTNLTASNITASSATVQWTPQGDETEWSVQYRVSGASDWIDKGTVTTPSCELDNLAGYTDYDFRVRPECTEGTQYTQFATFKTLWTTVTLDVDHPYSTNFEGDACDWYYLNGNQTNKWVWGSATQNGGSKSLYISNDGGISNYYNISSESVSYALKPFHLTAGYHSVSFDWKNNGDKNGDYLRVALAPASATLTPGTTPMSYFYSNVPSGWIALDGGDQLYGNSAWQSHYTEVNVSTGGDYVLVLAWVNNSYSGNQPPAAIDNISFSYVTCPRPKNLTLLWANVDKATFMWTAVGSATTWNMQYRQASETAWTDVEATINDHYYILNNLEPNTDYQVRIQSGCGSNWTEPVSFKTLCEPTEITTFTERFSSLNSLNLIPECWSLDGTLTDESNQWKYTNSGHNGNGVYFTAYSNPSGKTTALKTPIMNLPADETIQLSFWYKNDDGADFSVYISTDRGRNYTTALATNLTTTNGWTEKAIVLPDEYIGAEDVVFVFQGTTGTSYKNVFLDDVIVGPVTTCPKPQDLHVTALTESTATLAWTNGGTENTWEIAYSTDPEFSPDFQGTHVTATTNPFTVMGLSSGVTYYAYVRAKCSAEDQSRWCNDVCSFYPVKELTVNDGTTTNVYVPVELEYLKTTGNKSQFIIPAETLTNLQNSQINKLTFYCSSSSAYFNGAVFRVYMTEANQTSYGNFYPSGNMTLVYTGNFSVRNNKLEIILNTPYNYFGGNLIIGIYESSKGSSNGDNVNWYGVSTSSNTAIYKHTMGLLTGRVAFLPKTTFSYAPFTSPFDLTASNISAEGATLSWQPMGDETHWDVFYTDNPDYVPAANTPAQFSNIGTNPFVMTGVEPGRTYYVYVRANNGADGVSEWSSPCSFMLASLLTVNEGTVTNNFVPVPGWYVDLPFNGEFVIPAADLQAMANTEIRQMTFYTTSPIEVDWGELNYNLYLQEVDFDEINSFHSGGQLSFSGIAIVSNYQMTLNLDQPYYYRGGNLLVRFDSEHNGAVNKVVAYWAGVETENTENHWSSAILYRETSWFNIHRGGISFLPKTTFSYVIPDVVPQYCDKPNDLEVSDITTTSATVSWTANGDGQQWEMQYKNAYETDYMDVQGTVTNPYTFQDLEPSHGYWIRLRSVCGDELYSDWEETWFSTECVPLISLPYSYDFEDMKYDVFPPCWSYYSSDENIPWVESYNRHSGRFSLVMGGNQTEGIQFTILPEIPVNQYPMNGTELVFYGAMYNGTASVQVGIMTDPNDPGTFMLVEELNMPDDFEFRKHIVSFADYTGNGSYIAIRKENTNEIGYLFIDDVLVRPIPNCAEPTGLTVSNIAQNTATLQWTARGSETAWHVQYKLADDSNNGISYEWPDTYQTVSQNSCTLNTLAQGTSYEVRVRAACSDTETSEWTGSVRFTTKMVYTAPFFEDFGQYSADYWLTGWGYANALMDDVLNGTPLEVQTLGTWGTGSYTNRMFTNADNRMRYYSEIIVYLEGHDVANRWLITPDIVLDQGWQLNFDLALIYDMTAASGLEDNRFAVLVTDDNGASWTTLGLWDYSGTAGRSYYDIPRYPSEVTFDLTAYNNKTIRIAFYLESTVENEDNQGNLVTNTIYLDKVNVTKHVKPGNVVVSNITTTSALFDWVNHGETSCTLQYRRSADEEWTTVTTTQRPYTLTGLSCSNDYIVRMKANYNTGESEWSELALFATECVPIHLGPDETYEQTFNLIGEYYFSGVRPACWSTSGDNTWEFYGGAARASHASSTTSSSGDLITPDIEVTPGLTLVFNHSTELNSLAYVQVYVMIDNYYSNLVWSSDVDDLSSPTTTISLGNFVGQTVNIYFYYHATINANYGTASPFYLYDVSFYNKNTFTKQTDDGYWNETDNWSTGILPEASESVVIDGAAIIPNDYVAQVDEIYLTSNGSLTLADGAQLKHNNEGVEAKVWKTITPYTIAQGNGEEKSNGWNLIASPMQSEVDPSGNMLSNNFDLYRFNQRESLEWLNYQQYFYLSPYFKLFNGQGYLYANSGDGYNPNVMIDMEGQLRPAGEDVSVSLVYDANAILSGWNLVGNPFACNAYLTEPRDFYVLNADRNELTISESNVIAPMEGLFVQAADANDNAVTFTTTMPQSMSTGGALTLNVYEGSSVISGTEVVDRAKVRFDNGSTLSKFSLNPNGTKLFITRGHQDYAVVSADATGEMPVSFKAERNGTYTISVNLENVEFDYLHLIDTMTGADVDLLAEPNYTFTARPTDDASRFRLVFRAK